MVVMGVTGTNLVPVPTVQQSVPHSVNASASSMATPQVPPISDASANHNLTATDSDVAPSPINEPSLSMTSNESSLLLTIDMVAARVSDDLAHALTTDICPHKVRSAGIAHCLLCRCKNRTAC